MLAVDVVGARIFGLTFDEVPRLKIAYERNLEEGDLNKISIIGKNIDVYREKYEWDLFQKFPRDITILNSFLQPKSLYLSCFEDLYR